MNEDKVFNCKLAINNAQRLRHYWCSKKKKCDCGCRIRIFVKNHYPICAVELREELNKQGFSLEKIYNTGSVGSNEV